MELCWKDGKKGRMEENEREIEWFWNEDELNGMDVNIVIDEVEMIIENVNMSDSKRESYWELNSD